MLGFVLIILVVGVTLTILLTVGALFFQGYLYTEPSSGVFWQAPLAGVILTVFLLFWCILNANSETATTVNIPYDTLFRASGSVSLVDEPVEYLWVVRKGQKEPVKYVRQKYVEAGFQKVEYVEEGSRRGWRNPESIEAILIEHDGEKIRFEPHYQSEAEYRTFVSPEGWEMPEYDRGVAGQPSAFHEGLFFVVLLLNFVHLALWIVCLWLIVRFQFWHALGLGLVMWGILTLFVVPNLLTYAVTPGVLKSTSSAAAPEPAPAPEKEKQNK